MSGAAFDTLFVRILETFVSISHIHLTSVVPIMLDLSALWKCPLINSYFYFVENYGNPEAFFENIWCARTSTGHCSCIDATDLTNSWWVSVGP